MKRYSQILPVLVIAVLGACEAKPANYRDYTYYVDHASFAEGRPCAEVLFHCLPESLESDWQQIDSNDTSLIENYQPTQQDKDARQRVIEAEDVMKLSKATMQSFERMEHSRFMKEQAANLEKEFPGFWRDAPKPVQVRWIKRAISKAHKYGYNGETTDSIQIIRLCARIGLDFDLDPKWEAITQFIAMPDGPLLGYGGEAVKYIDFTVFEKDYSSAGTKFTDWSLRDSLQYLPYPKRNVPRLND